MGKAIIDAAQAKNARHSLGLTQSQVADQAGVSLSYIKRFETNRESGSAAFQKKLADFFSSQGVDLDEMFGSQDVPSGASAYTGPGRQLVKPVMRRCFYISPSIPDEAVDSLLGQMDVNDDRVAELLPQAVQTGFIGSYSRATEEDVRELIQRLAQNYLLFRVLQGRNILAPREASGEEEERTLVDVVSKYLSDDTIAALLSSIPAAAIQSQIETRPQVEQE